MRRSGWWIMVAGIAGILVSAASEAFWLLKVGCALTGCLAYLGAVRALDRESTGERLRATTRQLEDALRHAEMKDGLRDGFAKIELILAPKKSTLTAAEVFALRSESTAFGFAR